MGITAAVLSWGSPKTLLNTLRSYAYFGLKAEQKLVLLQEATIEGRNIADFFGYDVIEYPINVGIALGYKALLDTAQEDLFLFLENDWELVTTPNSQINIGSYLLNNGIVDLVRYRSRTRPGEPLWTRQFEDHEYERPTHLLDSIHWTDPSKFPEIKVKSYDVYEPLNPANLSGDILESFVSKSVDWFVTHSCYANWTNNPHMARTEFLRQYIHPRLSDDIEKSLQPWWEKQKFLVAQSEGLFTHNRID